MIFKAAVLIAEQADGSVAALAARSSDPVLEAARNLRDTGGCVINGVALQAPAGARGVVLANFRNFPLMKFKVGGEIEAEAAQPEVEVEAPAGKPRGRK